jgi:chitodextrinase
MMVALAALALPAAALAIPSNQANTSWGVNGRVRAIVQVGDTVYVGGAFTQAAENGGAGPATAVRNNLAAFSATTGALLPWDPNASAEVDALAVSADGTRVFAGGTFASVGGATHTRLAAIDAATGAVDPTWTASASSTVRALAVSGNRLFVGGSFGTLNGSGRTYIGALAADTGALTTWKPSANAMVRALLVSPDATRVYAGGDFTTIAGVTRKNVAALDPSSGAALSWHPDPGYPVLALAATAATVYTAGGGSANTLASWDAGSGARRWAKVSDGDFQAVAVSGAVVYAGGHYLEYDGNTAAKRLVAVDAGTGNLRPDWAPSVNGAVGVWAVSVYADTRLAIGGDFTVVSGRTQNHYALFVGDTTGPPDLTAPSAPAGLFAGAVGGSKVNLSWRASGDDVGVSGYRVFRNGTEIATVAGTAYTDESVAANTKYTYTVQAFDSANHVSAGSNAASVTTGPPDQVLTFTPTADAYINAAKPNTNFGSATSLKLSTSKVSLLKFALAGINHRLVVSAKLRLACTDTSNDGGHFRRAATNSWSEGAVTWNNAPGSSGLDVATLSDVTSGKSYDVDLTPMVADDGTVSVRVSSAVSDTAAYSSKEGATKPQLIVRVATAPALPFADDFESGDLSKWSSVRGMSVQGGTVAGGSFAARATASGSSAYAQKQLTQAQNALSYQVRANIVSQGANPVVLERVRTATGVALAKVYVDASGKLTLRNDVTGTTVAGPLVSKGAWHTVELAVDVGAGKATVSLEDRRTPLRRARRQT